MTPLITRLFTGWNFPRILFLMLGAWCLIQSIVDGLWLGILVGGYFVAMSIFRIGCVPGGCFSTNSGAEESKKPYSETEDVHFEDATLK